MAPRFWFRKPKTITAGQLCPATVGTLYLRLTVAGFPRPANISTNISTAYGQWSAPAQRLLGKDEATQHHNARLAALLADAWRHYYDLERAGRPAAPELIARLLGGGALAPQHETLLQAWDAWGTHQQARHAAGEIAAATACLATYRRPHLVAWLAHERRPALLLAELTAPLCRGYRRFLLTHRPTVKSPEFASKVVRLLGECVSCAVERGALPHHHLTGLDLPRAVVPVPRYLEPHHLTALKALPLLYNVGLQNTRDAFLLQCYTGFAWADLRAFDPAKHIKAGDWISHPRQKTGTGAELPLRAAAKAILLRHDGVPPVAPNWKMNARLKELGALIGLDFPLTTHVGRHTFAQLALDAGVSLEVVSAMLGHKSTHVTQQHYCRIKAPRIAREMQAAGLG